MSDEHPSPSATDKPRSAILPSLISGAGAIAGIWGLVQIIIFFNPFAATGLWFYGRGLGLLILVLGLAIFVWTELAHWRRSDAPVNRFGLVINQVSKWLRYPFRNRPLAALAAALLNWLAKPSRFDQSALFVADWIQQNLSIAARFAIFMFALFSIILSWGRINTQ